MRENKTVPKTEENPTNKIPTIWKQRGKEHSEEKRKADFWIYQRSIQQKQERTRISEHKENASN